MSDDEGDAAEAKELSRGLQSISGVRFKDAAPIAPSGWKLEQEAPWHLSAAYMYALGSGNREIAKAHGKSPQAVSNLFHQPFFQERVTAIMAENRRDVMDLFRGERINSLAVLIEIRDNLDAPAKCTSDVREGDSGLGYWKTRATDRDAGRGQE